MKIAEIEIGKEYAHRNTRYNGLGNHIKVTEIEKRTQSSGYGFSQKRRSYRIVRAIDLDSQSIGIVEPRNLLGPWDEYAQFDAEKKQLTNELTKLQHQLDNLFGSSLHSSMAYDPDLLPVGLRFYLNTTQLIELIALAEKGKACD